MFWYDYYIQMWCDSFFEKPPAARLELIFEGKEEKKVPTIFTAEVQKVIKILLESRSNIDIPDNHVLFCSHALQNNL